MVRCYADRPANVAAMLRASFTRAADCTAVMAGATRIGYEAFGVRAETLAANLAWLGVKPGERVALMAHNGLEAILGSREQRNAKPG